MLQGYQHHVVPVQLEGCTEQEEKNIFQLPSSPRKLPYPSRPVKIMIDIRMSNGMYIQQRNLSYRSLKKRWRSWRGVVEYYRYEPALFELNDIAALAYLKKFFGEVVEGRRDYDENLLPMIIGINTKTMKVKSVF